MFVAAMQKLLPNVPLDMRLTKGQSTNRGEAFYNLQRVPDSSSANATLIYWQMLAEAGEQHHFRAPAT
jgi:hypothetical protein